MILPGAMLGMLGGGQLGRFFVLAARQMGYRVMVLDADPHSPAGQLADVHLQAGYDDPAALDRIAAQCAVATTEFENVPAQTLDWLAEKIPVYPSADAVRVAQNRLREKRFVREAGLETARFAAVSGPADFAEAAAQTGFPAILKTTELGYDGKGQRVLESADQLPQAFAALGEVECILEARVSLAREISVVVARDASGGVSAFPVAENVHRHGILHRSRAPAACGDALTQAAQDGAKKLAAALDYVGVLAVEYFETTDHRLLVNEIAPRTHNSGHYTLDACATSQFEQQLRMICGLGHGDTRLLAPVVMINLLGDLWSEQQPPAWAVLLEAPDVKLHLYGKREARPGRKMGHFNVLGEDQPPVERAEALFERL